MSIHTVADRPTDCDQRADLLAEQSFAPVVYVVADSEKRTAVTRENPVIAALSGPGAPTGGMPVFTVSDVQGYRIDLSRPRLVILSEKAASILRTGPGQMTNAVLVSADPDAGTAYADGLRHGVSVVLRLPDAGDWLAGKVRKSMCCPPCSLEEHSGPADGSDCEHTACRSARPDSRTPAVRRAVQLLAAHEAWADERADLSAAEADGGAGDAWHGSDDDGCDLANSLADALRDLLAEQ